ncbi:MAG: peptidyl-prolyl cis-trans isomerase [Woeseiaceae bacterium]
MLEAIKLRIERIDVLPGRRIAAFLLREPLVHFLGLAVLLFAASSVWSGPDKEIIRINQATADFLIKQRADIQQRSLSPPERQKIINDYIDDEIVWRESYKRGLDKSARIRKQMIQNMRFLLTEDVPQPTDEDLKVYFATNKARFMRQSALTLDHVFFADPSKIPASFLQQLEEEADPKILGDDNPSLPRSLVDHRQDQIVGLFGQDNAREILALKDGEWLGPLQTSHGGHFVRIAVRRIASMPSFEELRRWLEMDYEKATQRAILQGKLAEMRKGYKIIIETKGTTTK